MKVSYHLLRDVIWTAAAGGLLGTFLGAYAAVAVYHGRWVNASDFDGAQPFAVSFAAVAGAVIGACVCGLLKVKAAYFQDSARGED